jgi:hypothetical protein
MLGLLKLIRVGAFSSLVPRELGIAEFARGTGSVATLEDWFDPKRLRSDYAPTGFKGYGVTHRSVPGHAFGLNLSSNDKDALIAFLKTL